MSKRGPPPDVLKLLREHPEGLTANALARAHGWVSASGALIARLNWMAERGVLVREPAPRRGVRYRPS